MTSHLESTKDHAKKRKNQLKQSLGHMMAARGLGTAQVAIRVPVGVQGAWTFDMIALMLGPPASCCVCVGRGWRSRCIKDHAVSSGNLFVICYIGWFCIVFVSLPHIRFLEYFITSSSFKWVKKKTSRCILDFFLCTRCLYMKKLPPFV
jgi:hypothetical protein